MAMYNTDDVRLSSAFMLEVSLNMTFLVNNRLCTFIIQDGPAEEDAPGKLAVCNISLLVLKALAVLEHQEHNHEEVRHLAL